MLKSLFRDKNKPSLPQSFGYKNAWLSLKTADADAVVNALELKRVRSAPWETGIKEAYSYNSSKPNNSGLFITPPLGEWILVVGRRIANWWDGDGDEEMISLVRSRLSDLSRIFDDAQYFLTHRVIEMHVWARAINGVLVRGYAYIGESGETPWNEGPQTEEEKRLGIAFFDHSSPDAEIDGYWERKDLSYPNEKYVMQIAKAWSIGPADIEEQFQEPSVGILGWMD